MHKYKTVCLFIFNNQIFIAMFKPSLIIIFKLLNIINLKYFSLKFFNLTQRKKTKQTPTTTVYL